MRVELLVECARRKDGDGFELFREQALDLLGELGPEAAPAVPFLVELAQPANSDSHLRLPAIRALARLGPDCVSAVRPLSNLLTDPNPEVRREAADALRRYGPAASEIVPALVRALRVAPDYEQRQYREALDATGIGEVRILIWFVIIGLADNSLWVGVVGSFAVVLMAGRAWYRWCDQLRYPPTSKYSPRP